MLFSTVAAFLAASAVVSAQTVHNVVVGGAAGKVFTPNQITAAEGDIVTFEFQTQNHTVTQSAFADPCKLLQNATTNQVGFDSGFVPVSANQTQFPAWSIKVTNASAPIWFYCKQTGHCQSGMVGAINAPSNGTKTFAAFQALATSSAPTTGTSTSNGSTTNNAGVGASASAGVSDPAASGSSSGSSGATGLRVAHVGAALGAVAAGVFLIA